MTTNILVKRPVAFRVRRANDDGMSLSKTEWRYFTDEAEARREAEIVDADYQALYVRDGTVIVAELEDVRLAILDTLKKSAPGISEVMRHAIAHSIAIKLRLAKVDVPDNSLTSPETMGGDRE